MKSFLLLFKKKTVFNFKFLFLKSFEKDSYTLNKLQKSAGLAYSISDAGGWDLDGFNEGRSIVIKLEWLLTSFLHQTSSVAAVSWHTGEVNLLGLHVFSLKSTSAFNDWFH